MTWWLGVCFAVWLAGGAAVWRLIPRIRPWLEALPRTNRAVSGILFMIGSGLLLFMSLIGANYQSGRIEDLSGLGIGLVLAGGLVFVVLQCFTAMILLSLTWPSVTIGRRNSSIMQNPEGNDS